MGESGATNSSKRIKYVCSPKVCGCVVASCVCVSRIRMPNVLLNWVKMISIKQQILLEKRNERERERVQHRPQEGGKRHVHFVASYEVRYRLLPKGKQIKSSSSSTSFVHSQPKTFPSSMNASNYGAHACDSCEMYSALQQHSNCIDGELNWTTAHYLWRVTDTDCRTLEYLLRM